MLVEHELDAVVLVGHSYAGMVLAGAIERTAERIGRRIALDANTLCTGESAFGLGPPTAAAAFAAHADAIVATPAAPCDTALRTGGTTVVTGRACAAIGVTKSAQRSAY